MDALSLIANDACIVLGISVIVTIAGWRFRGNKNISVYAVFAALAPSIICLVLFWSLALHMYLELGDWPLGIGYGELDGSLLFHAKVTFGYFWQVIVPGILAFTVFCALSAIFSRWRGCLIYLGLCAAGISIVNLMMFLAPSGFQNWWWD